MQQEDFEEKDTVVETINQWAEQSVLKSKAIIDSEHMEDFPVHPFAGHTGIVAQDKVLS